VIEYCEHGDVSSALARPRPAGFTLAVARGIASGMLHLHQCGVLHRDLKGANVLLDSAWGVKISDFGLATPAPDDTRAGGWLTAETGTYRFMAPEVCVRALRSPTAGVHYPGPGSPLRSLLSACPVPRQVQVACHERYSPLIPSHPIPSHPVSSSLSSQVVCHERYSKSADVFSFACVLFELLTHEPPFADRSPLQAAVAVGLNHSRPPLPNGVPRPLAELVHACWRHEPTDRPSFAAIHMQLEAMAARLTEDDRAWLDVPDGHPVYKTPAAVTPGAGGADVRVWIAGLSRELSALVPTCVSRTSNTTGR
jgi:serine/threonine protein kinase